MVFKNLDNVLFIASQNITISSSQTCLLPILFYLKSLRRKINKAFLTFIFEKYFYQCSINLIKNQDLVQLTFKGYTF